jgi:hypothetical protein
VTADNLDRIKTLCGRKFDGAAATALVSCLRALRSEKDTPGKWLAVAKAVDGTDAEKLLAILEGLAQ